MEEVRSWHKIVVIMLKLGSLLSLGNTLFAKTVFILYKINIIFLYNFIIIPEILSVYKSGELLSRFREILSIVLNTGAFLTILFIQSNNKSLENFLSSLIENFENFGKGNDFHRKVENSIRKRKLCYFILSGIQIAVGFSLTGMFSASQNLKHRKLPISFWLPFNWRCYPYYEILFAIQVFVQLLVIIFWNTMFSIIFFTNTLFSYQLGHIAFEFSNCMDEALENYDSSLKKRKQYSYFEIDNVLNTIGRSKSFERIFCSLFREKTQKLQSLLKLRRISSKFFEVLLSIFVTMGILCLIIGIITFTNAKENAMNKSFALRHTISVFIFMIQKFAVGEIIVKRYEKILYEVYNIPWYFCGLRPQKMIYFTLVALQSGAEVKIGGWAALNFETFLKVLKIVYSFVTMALHLIERNQETGIIHNLLLHIGKVTYSV